MHSYSVVIGNIMPWVVSPNLPLTSTEVKSSCRYPRCASKHTISRVLTFS